MTRHTPTFIVQATLVLLAGSVAALALHLAPVLAVCVAGQAIVALVGAVGVARKG